MAKSKSGRPKPIRLYDHLPGILSGYPAIIFLLLALLQLPHNLGWQRYILSADSIFWIGLVCSVLWYIAFRFNLPKRRFWLVFGLAGTFVGIPIVLELTGYISPFRWIGRQLGRLHPEASSGAWLIGSIVFACIWVGNMIWSRTHLRVKIDESGLSIDRVGGKGERFDLIGLKTEHEPLDYLETFLAGIGTLSLKTRLNKPIFTMKRVVGLYWTPFIPWERGKLKRIEEMLSYQGKVLSVEANERAEMAEAMDASSDEDGISEDDHEIDQMAEGEFDDGSDGVQSADSPDIR